VPDRYIGYSTKFEEMVNGVFAGEFSPQYMDFVDEHGTSFFVNKVSLCAHSQ